MASPMVSRWPVLVSAPFCAGDLDAEGLLTAEGAARLSEVALADYVQLCTSVDRSLVRVTSRDVRGGPIGGDTATLAAGVVEIFSDRVTFAVRVRGDDGGSGAVDINCTVTCGGEITKAIRDEFIALAHGAQHMS